VLQWGVIGVGLAGRARTRALHEDPRSEVRYGMRGDPASVGLRRVDDLGELLRHVDAVAICSPDSSHPQLVRRALSAGKHVLVEFPLAGSAEVGRDLLRLASDLGRVLHVEHIELLGSASRYLREAAAGQALRGGTVRFTTGPRKGTYGVAHANVARLHRLVDAVGLPDAVRLIERGPRHLRAALRYPQGEVELDFRQDADLSRHTWLRLDLGDRVLEQHDQEVRHDGVAVALPPAGPLFVQDQLVATARILDGAAPYIDEARILAVLGLADALVRASPDGGWANWSPPAEPPPDEDEASAEN